MKKKTIELTSIVDTKDDMCCETPNGFSFVVIVALKSSITSAAANDVAATAFAASAADC